MNIIFICFVLIRISNTLKTKDFQSLCPIYKCGGKMTDNKCLSLMKENYNGKYSKIFYLNNCQKNEKCSVLSWDSNIGVCTKNIRKSFGGEKCQSDEDCYSQNCNSNEICENKNINENCNDDKECGKEAVCIYNAGIGETASDKSCRNLVKLEESCILDETDITGFHSNCPIFSVCSNNISTPDAVNGYCVEQNSLENGEPATNFRACKGNNIILLKNGYYVCSELETNAKACEIPSDQSNECINKIIVGANQEIDPTEKLVQSKGICRCDIDGLAHCHVHNGPQYKQYINLIKEKIKNKKITQNDFHVATNRETFNDLEIAQAYFNYLYDDTKSDECAKRFIIDELLLPLENSFFIKYNAFYFFMFLFFLF